MDNNRQMTLREYLEEACPYLECCMVGGTVEKGKEFFNRVAKKYNLEEDFSTKAKEDIPWQELAKGGIFYFVDLVKPGLYLKKVEPESMLLKLEMGEKAVLKLLVDAETVRSCR